MLLENKTKRKVLIKPVFNFNESLDHQNDMYICVLFFAQLKDVNSSDRKLLAKTI